MFKAIESRSDDSLSFGEFVEVSVYKCSVCIAYSVVLYVVYSRECET